MDRVVKERLVGAAVLMAAAIILIPEMLSGPANDEGNPQAAESPARSDTAIKTYTIDLNQPPGTPAASTSLEDRAPPPEETTLLPAEALPPLPSSQAQAKPEARDESRSSAVVTPEPPAAVPASSTSVVRSTAPAPAVVEPPTQPARPPEPVSHPLASTPSVPTSGGWAVQLGSFSKQATAERLMKEMRGQGHEAFVMPVKSGAATLYRVRIGPMNDRAGAEATLRAVKTAAPGAAIVAHP